MKIKNLILRFCFSLLVVVVGTVTFAQEPESSKGVNRSEFDYIEIRRLLETQGIVGEVHAAVPHLSLYVFTYRDPKDFFNFAHMSMLSLDDGVRSVLRTLKRHDKVLLRGSFMDNPSPQMHIDIKAIEVVSRYESPIASPPHNYEAKIPDELAQKDHALFLIHTVRAEGKLLVVEYKDAILPIFNENLSALSKDLARNDLIEIYYKLQKKPGRPQHLRLNEEAAIPLKVVQSVMPLHGKAADVEGQLVLFPKSPQVAFNVFAVLEPLAEGLQRQYTLINFNPDGVLFAQIRDKLQKAWDAHSQIGDYYNGRNKLINTKVRVRAKGIFNAVDVNQANLQIGISKIEDLEVVDSTPKKN